MILAEPNLTASPIYPVALTLLLLGAFTKSAQFPFHFWLPGAMAAPTPASAYLHSATMVKAGIYLVARLQPALGDSPLWFWSLFLVGGFTMVLGAVSALRYTDMKAILAYTTIAALGTMMMLLAMPEQTAVVAAMTTILAHALYKAPLFLTAGTVDHAMGTRDLRNLAGLWRVMPLVMVVAVLGALSMAGVPPTWGFVAKELLLENFFELYTHGATLDRRSWLCGSGRHGDFQRRRHLYPGVGGFLPPPGRCGRAGASAPRPFFLVCGPRPPAHTDWRFDALGPGPDRCDRAAPGGHHPGRADRHPSQALARLDAGLHHQSCHLAAGLGIVVVRRFVRALLARSPAWLNGVYRL